MKIQKKKELGELILENHRLLKTKEYRKQLKVLESICRLAPGDTEKLAQLALVQIRTGAPDAAAINLARCILNSDVEIESNKTLFVFALSSSQEIEFRPDLKQALQLCLENPYHCDAQSLMSAWMQFLLGDPQTATLKTPVYSVEEREVLNWADSIDERSASMLADDFFIDGLCSLIMANPVVEIFLTRLRRYLCLNMDVLESSGRIGVFRRVLFALATQCYINEFVFLPNEDEIAFIETLKARAESLPDTGIALLGCYQPLHNVLPVDQVKRILADTASDEDIKLLLKTHYLDRVEEIRLAQSIREFGEIDNDVSVAVKSQYEENPYPRWLGVSSRPGPLDDIVVDADQRDAPWRILVAGCGTGQHAIQAAARHPKASVVAIDLSEASLGYASRKAKEAGLADRFEFVRADILSMRDWPEQFDIIECSGVLHHMQDPSAGLAVLNERLKPGGYLKLGLYSKLARTAVIQAREYVRKNDLSSSAESIRRMRYVIFNQPAGGGIREFFVSSVDFYTTSRVRDAIFHVQEHQYDLPEIREMIKKFSLEFVRFTINRIRVRELYKQSFPDDPDQTDLENWEKLEKEHPGLFAGMYQFWMRKPS